MREAYVSYQRRSSFDPKGMTLLDSLRASDHTL